MKIKSASKKHISEIVELMRELGYSSDKDQIKERLAEIKKRDGEVFVAINDQDKIIGCVHALIDVRLAEGKIGEIVSLVVEKSARGHGIGTKLLNKAKNYILKSDCTQLRVRANAVRINAHQFYQNQGFEEVKSQKIFEKGIDSRVE